MKAAATVAKDFKTAIDIEATLHNKYQLSKRQFKYWGLNGPACHLGKFQHSCHDFVNMITRRALFLQVEDLSYQPDKIGMDVGVKAVLATLLDLEVKASEFYETAVANAFKANDTPSMKLFSHLCKWHQADYKTGKGDGHLDWLEKQIDQINRVGEKEYITAHI
jgi:bacterioferritin (cytochrome b1)